MPRCLFDNKKKSDLRGVFWIDISLVCELLSFGRSTVNLESTTLDALRVVAVKI